MTTALEGGEWSASHPGRTLPSGKIRYPFYRRLGGIQSRSRRAENFVPIGIRSRTVQPVVSTVPTELPGPHIHCLYTINSNKLDVAITASACGLPKSPPVCIAVFTVDAGLLARSQYSEGPATGHHDAGFSWLPCVYKQMLRWFPRF